MGSHMTNHTGSHMTNHTGSHMTNHTSSHMTNHTGSHMTNHMGSHMTNHMGSPAHTLLVLYKNASLGEEDRRSSHADEIAVRDCNVYMLCPCVRSVVLLCDDVYLKGSVPGRLQSI